MSKRKLMQGSAAIFLVIAVILLIPNTEWGNKTAIWGFVSLVCGTLGSIISIFIPTNYVFTFEEKEWMKDDGGYKIIITSKKHGCGKSPQVQTYEIDGNNCEEVGVTSNHDSEGNVIIGASSTFKGKIVIT